MTLYNHIKNIALLIICVYTAPIIIKKIHERYSSLTEQKTNLALITLSGTINDSARYTHDLYSFFENHHIKGILLTIDTNDVAHASAYALYNEITHLKREYHKPVVALIENRCSKESYLIACAADHIIASETTYIECCTIPTADSSNTSNLQQDLDKQHIKLIATARKLPLSTQPDWAIGALSGYQARAIKLIDQTGSLYNAITFFKQKTIILGKIEWIHTCKPLNLCEYLSHIFFGNQQTISQ